MMNKRFLGLIFVSVLSCTSCIFDAKPNILKEPSRFRNNFRKTANFEELSQNIRDFSAIFSLESLKDIDNKDTNNVVSPLSMFSALAIAAGCASGTTQTEILNALHTTEPLLYTEFANLYEGSNFERTLDSERKVVKKEELTNSIWIDKNVTFKQEALDFIAEKFYSYSVSVDYRNDNATANKQMSNFVKEKTNGLIKPSFDFNSDTLCTILNTLYLKSLWDSMAESLNSSNEKYTFTNRNGSKTNKNLLESKYSVGKIIKDEKYSSFFAETECGDRIKFVVPNDGVELDEILSEDIVLKMNNEKYEGIDEENKIMYLGRAIFPGFEAECDLDAKNLLKRMGINDFFSPECDFTKLTDEFIYCDQVKHVAKLKVDKKGIEGAAFTAIQMKGGAAPYFEYERIYEDFVVNKSFLYVVSDHNNLPVFSGVVNKV